MSDARPPTNWIPITLALRRVETQLRLQHYSKQTIGAYLAWVRRFWRFNRWVEPARLTVESARAYLSDLLSEAT